MNKVKVSTKQQSFTLIEELSRKINFLGSMKEQSDNESLLSAGVEYEFASHGYVELFEQIKASSKVSVGKIITKQIEIEKKSFSSLTTK